MNIERDMMAVLDASLGLGGRTSKFTLQTPLLGALPEFDSMAVMAVLAALEDHFGITVQDDEVDGTLFATVGSLVDFVKRKQAR